ncbi:MAG: 30S ribosomal protein S20 [Candidatus Midichloria sp.]|uniref:30S ribosomal protein S20 n=1 Tax=Hyalomma marginatum TaxID=34627 RepID=A0A8S4C271_9ACAR|nr:30S ribosomal protein S20 [Hyalomma marginatum]CAG7592643.1 30S ribosomal protein S20 [Hyalomma marginatum]
MANHKSALKAHKQSVIRAARNSSVRSRVKTFSNKVIAAVNSGSFESSVQSLRVAESEIMKSVTKGVLKLNTAARKVSKLAKKVKSLEAKTA